MLNINILQVSSDSKSIDISIETTENNTINSAILWTDKTFKDYTKGISLNSYLEQTSNKEVFSVPINTLGEGRLYFIEFTSSSSSLEECSDCNNNKIIGITGNLNIYKECILNKLITINPNNIDNKTIDDSINISMILDSLCIAIQFGYYDQILSIINTLDKLCKDNTCNECSNLELPSIKAGLNYGIFNNNLILI